MTQITILLLVKNSRNKMYCFCQRFLKTLINTATFWHNIVHLYIFGCFSGDTHSVNCLRAVVYL